MLGIIGGSGLYSLDDLQELRQHKVNTPFGEPSSAITEGKLNKQRIFFLARHGRNHEILPHEIDYRANIYALKSLGIKAIISISAAGSLQEDIAPGSLVVPSQYIDFTKARESTFFGNGLGAHVSTADPICPVLAEQVLTVANSIELNLIQDKTYICVNGPRFGTRAESNMFRQWGADIVGMTNVPEVFLAREAQISYVSLCIVTDYDAWREGGMDSVSDMLAMYSSKVSVVQSFLREFLERFEPSSINSSPARHSLDGAALVGVDSSLMRVLKT